jgi:hypothetical protein
MKLRQNAGSHPEDYTVVMTLNTEFKISKSELQISYIAGPYTMEGAHSTVVG